MPDLFDAALSDLSSSDVPAPRDLEQELFNRRTVQDMVTDFENELGLAPGKKAKTEVERRSVILSPNKESDQELLHRILNDDKKFRILMWKDTWTVHGDFRVFLIYEEVKDKKKPQA